MPADLDVHLVMDNYGTHKAPLVKAWLLKRPRWHVHFTPTNPLWLNQVKRLFALLTKRQLRHGVHRSVEQLQDAIQAHIDATNAEPKPFRWTKTANDILVSVERFCLRNTEPTSMRRTSSAGH